MNKYLVPVLLFLSTNLIAQNYSDCISALELCGETPIFIESGNGVGQIDPLVSSTCVQQEFNSTWISIKAVSSGDLTFTLTPSEEGQDLDFLVFKTTDNNCNELELLRCMASGQTVGQDSEPCLGATGLAVGETDTVEYPGCTPMDNNFLAPLEVEQDDEFIIMINEFSTSMSGFTIDFGGSASLECITTSIQDYESDDLLIKQSVSKDRISLTLGEAFRSTDRFLISNMSGALLFSQKSNGQNEQELDLSFLPGGIYIITLESKNRILISRRIMRVN